MLVKSGNLASINLGGGAIATVRLTERTASGWKWEAPTPAGVLAHGTRYSGGHVIDEWVRP